MDVLQHAITGELYIVTYENDMTMDTINAIYGPISAFDALACYMPNDCFEDVAWAKTQPWVDPTQTLDLARIERG